jgi:hypothetical protein
MNTPLVHVLSLALLTSTASAVTIWTESVNGDLSSNEAAPTAVVVTLGSNIINGNVNGTTDARDYVTFTVQPGQSLSAIQLLSYDDLDTGPANDGNTGFSAINLGSTSFIPSAGTVGSFLGANHLTNPQVGSNILPGLGNAGLGAAGFTGSLGPGTYSFLVQQTGPQLTGYSVDLVIVPEPSALMLSFAGLGMVLRRRRG